MRYLIQGMAKVRLSKDRLAILLDYKKRLLKSETIGIPYPSHLVLAEKFVVFVSFSIGI
jgi:hypothetical protein